MSKKTRGADLLVNALVAAGTTRIFALSGNQIMPVFDACIDSAIELVHVRHEAAAVHMADAWGRLTGEPGVALVTAGPGMTNTLSALYVALMAESPCILLSGHAPGNLLGRGAFQEMAQADMAGHVTKASWTATKASGLGRDVTRAFRLARSGRPGPVHLSLPFDLLESPAETPGAPAPQAEDFKPTATEIEAGAAEQVLDALAAAQRPLVLAGPAMMRGEAPAVLSELADATRVPVVCTESPRGVNDPSLGAFAEVLAAADLVLLLGKKLDFTLRFGDPPAVSAGCRFVQIDAEAQVLAQTHRSLDGSRRITSTTADPLAAARQLLDLAATREWKRGDWSEEVQDATTYRPPGWRTLESGPDGPLHAVEVSRAVQEVLSSDPDSVFVADGGEFGQWVQACISAPHRLINGTAGSIGTAIPFAMAARMAFPDSPVIAMLGDGTFGFHAMEFDTAVRYQIPFVAVVGNDAAWNAEYQIQLRDYGPDRLSGCELLPSRYDLVTEALGGHGERVSRPAELAPALERAFASGKPACVDVAVQRLAAPVIRRGQQAGEADGGH